MALQKTITFGRSGLSVPDAYTKIRYVTVDTERVSIFVEYYTSKEASDTNMESVDSTVYSEDFPGNQQMPGANPIQWAYSQLKARPEFVGATDV